MSDARRTEGEPHDRLTRIADRLLAVVEADLEYRDGDKCIVFMDDGKRGGIGIHGYDSDVDAMADLLVHLKAIFEANGKTLMVMPVRGG
ncbi:MAG TPA: hypothetical protein VGG82_07575 [Casimicrobiaceae bacterium]|jgi:hypothetical protein